MGRPKKYSHPKLALRPVSFAAYPEEIDRWRKAADAANRTFAWWIRNLLLNAEGRGVPNGQPAAAESAE